MDRVHLLPALAVVLLGLSPVVAAQGAGEPSQSAGSDAADGFTLTGAFSPDRTDDNLTAFEDLAEEFSDDVAILESFPEQFRVGNLTRPDCIDLRAALASEPYIARLAECSGPAIRPPVDRPDFQDTLQHVSFSRMEDAIGITDYTVGDVLLLDSLEYLEDPGRTSYRHVGALHQWRLDGDTLSIQDGRVGLISFKAGRDDGGAVALDFPDGATFERGGRGAVVHLPGQDAILVVAGGEWDDDVLVVEGFFSLHLRPEAPDTEPGPADEARASDIARAIADRKIGAEVTLDGDSTVTTIAGADGGVTVETYDDVNVTVQRGQGPATPQAPIVIRVSAELGEGRTFVANVPAVALGGPDVQLRAFTINDDGSRTELLLKEADSISDILDPTNDGGDFEYWVVRDKNGVQVLLSAAHFSTHEFTVAGFGEVIVQPSIVAGILVGVIGSAAAAAAMFRPRRRA